MSYRKVIFYLRLGGPNTGNRLSTFEEGVEFSFRNLNSSSREWIPLVFYSSTTKSNDLIKIGDINTTSQRVNIRGYDVTYVIGSDVTISELKANLSICGSEIAQSKGLFNYIQFRWLQTVRQTGNTNRDIVFLDNITISSQQHEILFDDFDNQTSIE